jgi:hypothetical protein
MKKAFKKERKGLLFDETTNAGWSQTIFTGKKKLNKAKIEKY